MTIVSCKMAGALIVYKLAMPSYDYKCEFCQTQVELALPVDHEVPECAGCRGKLKRLWSAVPIHFKGDGWAGKS